MLHFLKKYGYRNADADDALAHLKERLSELEGEGFPHEIGIFLTIRWAMSSALLKMQAGILNVPDAGRSTAMNARP